MGRLLLNFILPCIAMTAIWVTLAFPTPSAFSESFPVPSPVNTAIAGVGVQDDVLSLVEAHASRVPGLGEAISSNADCFQGLGSATSEKLNRCAPVVIQTLAQVVEYSDEPGVRYAIAYDETTELVEQLTLAATEACRASWAHDEDFIITSPACVVSQLNLVSYHELQ